MGVVAEFIEAGSGVGQYLCGAIVAECEIRGCISEGVPNDERGAGGFEALFLILQQRAVSPGAGLSDPEGSSSVCDLGNGSHSDPSPIKTMALNSLYLSFNFEQNGKKRKNQHGWRGGGVVS